MSDIQSAILSVLTDTTLAATTPALKQADIWFNDSLDTAPKDRLFAVIRMGAWDLYDSKFALKRRSFSVWIHAPRRVWTDHTVTRAPLFKCIIPALIAATQVTGEDGTLTSCCLGGVSADLTDDTYQTIVNNATFDAGVR